MTQWTGPAPQEVVYVVGDIHGRVDKLKNLLDRIEADIAANGGVESKVVFVGDYIDRGEASAEVLRFLVNGTKTYPDKLICLIGNHEQMLLDFLSDPTGSAKRWIRYGGLQTLSSFGVGAGLTTDSRGAGELLDAAGDLMEAMGEDLVDWIAELPRSWASGTLWVVHAGADPSVPMPSQTPKTLMWGIDAFLQEERKDGQWVAFGHHTFEKPFAEAGRIAVDTGAAYGGPMTAARIDPTGTVTFIST